MSWLLIGAVVFPLLLAVFSVTSLRCWLSLLVILAPLPALTLLAGKPVTLELPWLLLGMRLGLDPVNLPFLLLTGLLWLAAAVYARSYLAAEPRSARFYLFFLLTLAGNIGTVLALDAVSFYLFFTLMSFAAYGLITHHGDAEALRAGKVYLILTVIGEALLLAGMIFITAANGVVDLRELPVLLAAGSVSIPALWLVLVGFAIKLGVVPLHVWLPLAHPSAPLPASAILSGVLLKIGLLGWLRFLPFGELALPELGQLCVLLGAVATFYGVVVGLLQYRPKTVLAYSSVSQMGLMTLLVGVGLSAPQQWPIVFFTLILFSLHHGFAKAALFLGLGAVTRGSFFWLLVLPTLALAGAPLTSGAVAKLAFKDAVAGQQLLVPFGEGLGPVDIAVVLTLSSVTTGLLLARFLYLAWPRSGEVKKPTGPVAPCAALVLAGGLIPWAWAIQYQPALAVGALEGAYLGLSLLLLGISAVVATAAWLLWRANGSKPLWLLPEGDIVVLGDGLGSAALALSRLMNRSAKPAPRSRSAQSWRQQRLGLLMEKANNERGFLVLLLLLFVVFFVK